MNHVSIGMFADGSVAMFFWKNIAVNYIYWLGRFRFIQIDLLKTARHHFPVRNFMDMPSCIPFIASLRHRLTYKLFTAATQPMKLLHDCKEQLLRKQGWDIFFITANDPYQCTHPRVTLDTSGYCVKRC